MGFSTIFFDKKSPTYGLSWPDKVRCVFILRYASTPIIVTIVKATEIAANAVNIFNICVSPIK